MLNEIAGNDFTVDARQIAPVAAGRTRARTWWPAATRERSTAAPTKPVAPVNRVVMAVRRFRLPDSKLRTVKRKFAGLSRRPSFFSNLEFSK